VGGQAIDPVLLAALEQALTIPPVPPPSRSDDPLFMCQVISSAIVNAPPPHPVVKMLMRTNFACEGRCMA
jgi:hypothetical protein